ncbi:MAG: 2-oxo acid dehydrogenase subunit E2 [Corallococcus sp.]|nr:2-oxo acid dehydrogenase subunit E2 [Corallococcus sp.]
MKKKRADGYYIKNVNPYQKLVPHIMPRRYDAQNMAKLEVRCDGIDRFIAEQSKLDKNFSYADIILAMIVRTLAKRPSLNRFVKNKRIYQHNDITVAFTVKKTLRDDSDDTTVKIHCTGEESIDDVKVMVDKVLAENTGSAVYNDVDKTAKALTSAPHWLISLLVKILNHMDNHNRMPKSIMEVSPFHNSVFVTFLKSIHGPYIYHHCYEFGTTGLFLAIGKEKVVPVVECGEVKTARVMEIGVTTDERYCDGFYFVNSTRVIQSCLNNPWQLLERYDLNSEDRVDNALHTKDDKKHYKKLAKQQKREKKLAKKQTV